MVMKWCNLSSFDNRKIIILGKASIFFFWFFRRDKKGWKKKKLKKNVYRWRKRKKRRTLTLILLLAITKNVGSIRKAWLTLNGRPVSPFSAPGKRKYAHPLKRERRKQIIRIFWWWGFRWSFFGVRSRRGKSLNYDKDLNRKKNKTKKNEKKSRNNKHFFLDGTFLYRNPS